MRVKYSVERELLGTAGALKRAGRLIFAKTMLVMNGDTFLDVSLRELMEFHQRRKAFVTLATARVADSSRYGSLCLDRRNRITAFLEKSRKDQYFRSEKENCQINGGIYVFDRKLLRKIRNNGRVSLEKEVFPSLLTKKNVYAFTSDAYFLDIGIPEELRRAQRELPQRICVSHPR